MKDPSLIWISESTTMFARSRSSNSLWSNKHAIVVPKGLPRRDLRILDPILLYPSTVLGRERDIIINLEHIKAIITAQEVMLLNSKDSSFTPYVHELRRCSLLHKSCYFSGYLFSYISSYLGLIMVKSLNLYHLSKTSKPEMDNIDTAFKSPQKSDVKYSTINLRLTLLLKKESKRYNKDVKVTSIRNLDLQLFKVQLTEFGIGTEEGVAAELQELIGTEKNHNKGDVDVYGMMSIPVEAVAAYDSLSDDKELIDTYERLTALDGKRMFVLAAVGSHKKEVGRLRRDVSGSGVSKMQDLELLRSVAPKKRIVYTTTRPNDIKTPYEKMLENDVEFGAPDNRSSGFLKLCVDGVLLSIEEKKSEKEIWDHLTRLYEARALHNKKFLKRKLYALRMTESTSVTEHVNNLNTLFSQLTSLSCKIDSQERAEILLYFKVYFDTHYDQVIINLTSNVLSDYLVFDDVVAVILEEENRRNNNEDMQTSSRQVEALVVTRGRSMEPGSSGSHNYEDGNALCCEATVANESRERFADVWLFDTGATFHMTARREWFHQYKPISRGGSCWKFSAIVRIGSYLEMGLEVRSVHPSSH
ncbi:gag-pol polyprotein [Tanacetum coccineum]